jgi:asparagine synthase (glutamine-hydrolysing)
MCGIYGELSPEPDLEAGERATDVLAHRGPDERGTWLGEGIFLGARRLSIIDLAGGAQPIWNGDETCCIVYNGELYNTAELRRELGAKSHAFRTRSDTEVVLHAYEQWGPGALSRLNGMFAFAIWDERSRSLFLARDRIGEKPLYYFEDGTRLVFASEIKAMLEHPRVPRRVDPHGLANYLAFGHSTAPETMFEGVRKLLPGHYLAAGRGQTRVVSWWDVPDAGEPLGEEEAERRIGELLEDSVRRRLVADVPVGAFLSGGVDSTAIVALMQRHASARVQTFSLGFGGGKAYDERGDARRAAAALGTEHRELQVDHGELLGVLRQLVYHFDEPFGDAASFPVYLLSRFARDHVKVVLTGDGGDELFGGYRRYVADQVAPLYGRLPRPLTDRAVPALVDRLPRLRRSKQLTAALSIRDPGRRYPAWFRVLSPELLDEALVTNGHDPDALYARAYAAAGNARDHLNRLMYVDVKTYLPDAFMEKTDKATMAWGLEARMPLLDHRLVELAFRIPSGLKIRGVSTKRILKRAVRDLVPAETLKKRKHGFSVPLDGWLQGGLASYAREVLLDERTRRRGYFDPRVVERLWDEHQRGRHVRATALWLFLNFELWHRIYLDREPV